METEKGLTLEEVDAKIELIKKQVVDAKGQVAQWASNRDAAQGFLQALQWMKSKLPAEEGESEED